MKKLLLCFIVLSALFPLFAKVKGGIGFETLEWGITPELVQKKYKIKSFLQETDEYNSKVKKLRLLKEDSKMEFYFFLYEPPVTPFSKETVPSEFKLFSVVETYEKPSENSVQEKIKSLKNAYGEYKFETHESVPFSYLRRGYGDPEPESKMEDWTFQDFLPQTFVKAVKETRYSDGAQKFTVEYRFEEFFDWAKKEHIRLNRYE